MQVTRAPRDRIASPARTGAGRPVVLLGLRTENRTRDDLPGFCSALVAHLAAALGRAVLVMDGHNRQENRDGRPGAMIWSHGELEAPFSPVARERALAGINRQAAEGTGIEVVDTIGAPLAESLGWGRAAAFFVSFRGAGLAKYRWACNCPGVVLTSRWNLSGLNDLHICSSAATMQQPARMMFVPADAVRDLPDSPLPVRHGEAFVPSLCNFEAALPAVMACVDEMAAFCLPPDPVAPPPAARFRLPGRATRRARVPRPAA